MAISLKLVPVARAPPMIVQDLSKIRSSRCASRAASQVSAIARVLLLEFSDPLYARVLLG